MRLVGNVPGIGVGYGTTLNGGVSTARHSEMYQSHSSSLAGSLGMTLESFMFSRSYLTVNYANY